jgi:hypothetical protein
MYKTDFIVKYHDIENELTKKLEQQMAEKVASQISSAIQANFNFTNMNTNINIVTNINGNPILTKTITPTSEQNVVHNTDTNNTNNDDTNDDNNDDDDDDDDEDYNYTRKDIECICEKLYRDELISVFDAESLEDPKMDAGIKMVFQELLKHEQFGKFFVELSPYIVDNSKAKTEQEIFNYKRNSDYLLFIVMFSQQLFYLTHQCICKMLTDGQVEEELMNELKSKLITVFSYCKPNA